MQLGGNFPTKSFGICPVWWSSGSVSTPTQPTDPCSEHSQGSRVSSKLCPVSDNLIYISNRTINSFRVGKFRCALTGRVIWCLVSHALGDILFLLEFFVAYIGWLLPLKCHQCGNGEFSAFLALAKVQISSLAYLANIFYNLFDNLI